MGQSGGSEAASFFPALGVTSDPEPSIRFSTAEKAAVRILAAMTADQENRLAKPAGLGPFYDGPFAPTKYKSQK